MRTRVLLLGALAAASVLATQLPASAHEQRGVGPMQLVVGWGDEPTYTGYKNSVQVMVTEGGKPVDDIGTDLQVEVTYGNKSETLQLEPDFLPGVFGEEGDYRAWITPTQSGQYTFRVFGTHDGQKINESFTSGDKTFGEPVDVQEIQFPTKEPSTGELAGRLDRELARVRTGASTSVGSSIDSLRSDVDQARIIAIVAAVVALLAVAGLLVGMARSRGRASAGAPASRTT